MILWGPPAVVTTNEGEVQRWLNTDKGLRVDVADEEGEKFILKYTAVGDDKVLEP